MNEMLNGRRINREEIMRRCRDRQKMTEMVKSERRKQKMDSSMYAEIKDSDRVPVDSKWGQKAMEDMRKHGYFRG